jgi:DNA-binding MarR family transcriptional regulator
VSKSQGGLPPFDNSIDPDGEFPIGASDYFFYLLFLTARQRDLGLNAALAPTGMTMARWRILSIIRRIEGCAMSTLSRFSTVERTTLTRSVDQLVEEGLVVRWVPEEDRRQVCLALTETGQKAYSGALAALLGFNQQMLEGLEPHRVRDAARLLQAVLSNVVGDEALSAELLTFRRPSAAGV